jgi:hypothetical protein
MQNPRTLLLLAVTTLIAFPASAGNDPVDLMKTIDGFRETLPPPRDLGEQNGFGIVDDAGQHLTFSHLNGVAKRLGANTKVQCLVLLTYLSDRDTKIRVIAADAIENVVHAYPNGMSADDMTKMGTDGHREMVRRFVERIEKLDK